jgi:hypothetical protein
VTFRWRDYRHANALRPMTLDAHEFIRRFLLHSLPDGFHRIRHYGFLPPCPARHHPALASGGEPAGGQCRLRDHPAVPPSFRSDGLPLLWRHPAYRRDIGALPIAVRYLVNFGSRPNIELGGAAVAADAMTGCVRHLAEPSAGHKLGHAGAPKMPIAAPVFATDTARSPSPATMRGACVAPGRSQGTIVAAQNP